MSLNKRLYHLAQKQWPSDYIKLPEGDLNCTSVGAFYSICGDRSYRDRDSECANKDIASEHGHKDR